MTETLEPKTDAGTELPGLQPQPSDIGKPESIATESIATNELLPETKTTVQTNTGQKIRRVGRTILDRLGVPHLPGRGRPRLDGQPVKGSIPLVDPSTLIAPGAPGNAVSTSPGVPPVALAAPDKNVGILFRKIVVSSVKSILAILEQVTGVFAGAAGIDEAFTQKTLAKAKPDPEALTEFTESLEMVLAKYNVQPKHAEEWNLAISGARLLAPYGLLIVEFRAEMLRNRLKDQTGGKR